MGIPDVKICSESDLLKECQLTKAMAFVKDPYARSANALSADVSIARDDNRKMFKAIGMPVTFLSGNVLKPFYGHIRSVEADDTCTVDLVGGGRRRGVRDVTACTELDLEHARSSLYC